MRVGFTLSQPLSADWYRKESVISKLKVALTDVLCKFNMDRVDGKRIAVMIINKIIEKILELGSKQ